jgi:hypothetical protein
MYHFDVEARAFLFQKKFSKQPKKLFPPFVLLSTYSLRNNGTPTCKPKVLLSDPQTISQPIQKINNIGAGMNLP